VSAKTESSILVVDDTPANLDLLEDILARRDYEVRKIPSGQLALTSAKTMPPDLILLDIRMPDLDGYEVCEQLKADERTRSIPVIFISALQDTSDKLQAFAKGGVDYITKPFHSDEVLARVKTHLELQSLNRELSALNAELERKVSERTAELFETNRELLRAKEVAEVGSRAKSDFMAAMTHELRTPLHHILGFTQLLMQDSNLDAKQKEHLEQMQRSGNQLLAFIDDILCLVKIGSQRLETETEPFELPKLLRESSDRAREEAKNKGLEFAFDAPGLLPASTIGDSSALRRILRHLLSNAVKYTDRGRITLRVRYDLEKQRIFLDIEDTGIGISEQRRKDIFEAFKQVVDEKIKYVSGTGIGLTLTRGLIELMHGSLSFESEVGVGSRFKVELPLQLGSDAEELQGELPAPKAAVEYTRLTPAMLSDLPEELRFELLQAAQSLDYERSRAVIDKITQHNEALAATLVGLVDRFQFNRLIDMLDS